MKNFGLIVLGMMLGALAMYFYDSSDIESIAEAEIIKPTGLITPKEAMALDAAYTLKHQIINDSLFKKSTDGGDNRSSWWAIEDVESYITYAKNQAKDDGYILDGLRLYLGSLPGKDGETGLTTVFFIPTGYENVSQGGAFSFQGGGNDLKGSDGLNHGGSGEPPSSNYPQ